MSDRDTPTDPNIPVWIERPEQAKQGMARKEDMRNATAAPENPVVREEKENQG